MIAEQALNARMVVEEFKVGRRVESTCNGMKPGFLKWGKVDEDGEGVNGRSDGKTSEEKSERSCRVG
ncbi:hypothetical protein Goklo_023750 [Gossypium klotzschianum]|nr:hypothetical protein [Gossypium klotzschianum]